ncbi:hypothetical protein PVAND_004787 [Polypedilum vanderplanki]|uniref:Neurogenic mastermind-like N-terminal domain-containing protein n=1 Tax=Polypedilum vanderplanki TaxID=319348 RepID=A0A9J6BYM2_POLVA|nr:hypothetical protein PVAND_004787 [Polypedilum vanderplanki]
MEGNKFDNDEDEVIEVENVSPSKQIDRFHKRLELYRSHQNDCKFRVENSLSELATQQNNEIAVLRSKFLEEKPKRINKKASRKPLDLDRDIQRHRQFMPVISSANSSKFSVTIVHKLEFSGTNINQQQQQMPQQHQFTTTNNIQFKNFQQNNSIMTQPQITLPQQQQQQYCNPLNEFDDLDFNGMASLLGPLDPEILFDENLLPQMSQVDSIASTSTSSSYQFSQPADDRQFYNSYKGIYFNPNFMP